MTAANGAHNQPTLAIDWLFAHYNGADVPLGRPPGAPPRPAAGPSWADPESPPVIKDAADLRTANEWLKRERERLQQYTEMQLAKIRAEHQALVDQKYENEQTMILGCQELSHKEELLARQSRTLQQQAAGLSNREIALAGQLEQWSRTRSEVGDLYQVRVQTAAEAAQQLALLESLRGETLALQKSREASQAELEAMARALDEQREARAKERAMARAQQAQMDRRLRDLDQAEQALQRRVAELDELEIRLREEFEEQECQLAEQRKDLAALAARMRRHPREENGEVHGQAADERPD